MFSLPPDAVAMAIAVIVGFFIKSNPKAKEYYLSKLVPVVSFIILLANQIYAQVADAATLSASVPVALNLAAVLSFLKPALKAGAETFLVTGLHSAPKNVAEGIMLILAGLKQAKDGAAK